MGLGLGLEKGGGMTYRIRKNKRSIKGMRLKLSEMERKLRGRGK